MRYLIILLVLLINFINAKVLIVNSYDQNDQCGIPQLKGFLSVVYMNGYKPENFDIVFLNSRVEKKKVLKEKVSNILANISNYSAVVTFDDTAFKLIGIPASKKGIKVVFSGLNYPYEKYKKDYNLTNNISGVFEKLYVKEVLEIFESIMPINKIALFYSPGVSKIIKEQIATEIENSPISRKIDYFFVKTLDELKLKTKMVNENKEYTLFMPIALNVKNNNNEKLTFVQFKDIYLKNIKKPDVSINMYFTNIGFLGFGGVDFYKMGVQSARIFLKNRQIIENANDFYFFINVKRANEIGIKLPDWFIRHYLKSIIN